MNTGAKKLVIPLLDPQVCRTTVPLKAIYVLDAPRQVFRKGQISPERLSPREALRHLLSSTVRREIVDAERPRRQFAACTDLAARIPMAKISYPRLLGNLPKVRDLILRELGH